MNKILAIVVLSMAGCLLVSLAPPAHAKMHSFQKELCNRVWVEFDVLVEKRFQSLTAQFYLDGEESCAPVRLTSFHEPFMQKYGPVSGELANCNPFPVVVVDFGMKPVGKSSTWQMWMKSDFTCGDVKVAIDEVLGTWEAGQ